MILAAGGAAQVAFSAVQTGLPALGPALREAFRISLPELGVVLGATTLGTVLTVYGWGLLADRLGERRVLFVGLLGTALALVLAATASSFNVLVAALLLAGAAGGCTGSASARAIMGWFGPEERGLALGVRQTAVPVGAATAALLLPAVDAVAGVTGAFLFLAALALAGAVAAVGLREPAHRPVERAASAPPAPVRDRRIWRLGAGCALLVAAQYSLGAFFPVFLTEELRWSQTAAGGAFALALALSAVGRPWAGRWSDRRGHRVDPLRTIALAGAVAGGLSAALVGAAGWLVVPVLLFALVMLWSWNGLLFAAAGEFSGPAQAGAALGLLGTVFFAAGAAGPPLLGAVIDAGSWRAGLAAAALTALAGWHVLAPLAARGRRAAVDCGETDSSAGRPPAWRA